MDLTLEKRIERLTGDLDALSLQIKGRPDLGLKGLVDRLDQVHAEDELDRKDKDKILAAIEAHERQIERLAFRQFTLIALTSVAIFASLVTILLGLLV